MAIEKSGKTMAIDKSGKPMVIDTTVVSCYYLILLYLSLILPQIYIYYTYP